MHALEQISHKTVQYCLLFCVAFTDVFEQTWWNNPVKGGRLQVFTELKLSEKISPIVVSLKPIAACGFNCGPLSYFLLLSTKGLAPGVSKCIFTEYLCTVDLPIALIILPFQYMLTYVWMLCPRLKAARFKVISKPITGPKGSKKSGLLSPVFKCTAIVSPEVLSIYWQRGEWCICAVFITSYSWEIYQLSAVFNMFVMRWSSQLKSSHEADVWKSLCRM